MAIKGDVPHGVEEEFGFVPRFVSLRTGTTHRRCVDAVADAGRVTLDYPALNVFLRSGFFLDGATPFNEVRRTCPAPVVIPPREVSREAAIHAYIELFRQAVRRRARPDSVLGLSGGRDSRHILLELLAQRSLPRLAVTVAVPGFAEDVKIAKALTERVGLRHEVVEPVPERAVDDEAWKNIHTNFATIEHRWFACAARRVDDLAWWDGIAGDVLSAGLFLEPWNLSLFDRGRFDELADRLCYEPYHALWSKEYFPREAAVAALSAELARHKGAANPIGSFYFWNRTRSTIGASAFGMLGAHGQPTLAPYMDRDVWAFLASLPGELLIDKTFHTQTILEAYPEFRDIPFFEGGRAPYPDVLRRNGRALVAYVRSTPTLWRLGVLTRVARAMLVDARLKDIESLLSELVYAIQLRSLQQTPQHVRAAE
jgi:asparagine synthase (glutamine-hydrolysing)